MNFETNDGDPVITIHLARRRDGLKLTVRTDEEVEEFFRHWGGGAQRGVAGLGRSWRTLGDGNLPLRAYELPKNFGEQRDPSYTLANLGTELMANGSVNISFLRLVGISKPEGISFTVDSVVSLSGLENIGNRINTACGRFYGEYIKPAEIDVVVSARKVG